MRWGKWILSSSMLLGVTAVHTSATELGVAGSRFTVDGAPQFLLGISYYGTPAGTADFGC